MFLISFAEGASVQNIKSLVLFLWENILNQNSLI